MSRREVVLFSELPVPLLPFLRKMLDMKDCNKTNQISYIPRFRRARRRRDIVVGSLPRPVHTHLLLLAILDELVGRGGLGDVAGDIVEVMMMI